MAAAEFITPPRHISQKTGRGYKGFETRVVKAEADLQNEIAKYVYADIARPKISLMRRHIAQLAADGNDPAARKGLFEIVHDMKGESATFNQIAVAQVLKYLSDLLTADRHIDARFLQIAGVVIDGLAAIVHQEIGKDPAGPAAPVVKGLGEIARTLMPASKFAPKPAPEVVKPAATSFAA